MKTLTGRLMRGGGVTLAAVCVGLVTAGLIFGWLNYVRGAERAAAIASLNDSKQVVFAKANIPAGTRLATSMLETREVPVEAAVPGSSADARGLVGKTVRYPISAGEPVIASRLVNERPDNGGQSGLAYAVPAGLRAVSVPVSEVLAAGGMIVPGDRVDVLVSTEYRSLLGPFDAVQGANSSEARQHKVVVTALQDILVLAVGQVMTAPSDADRDEATLRQDQTEPQPKAASVTLAVSPDEAQSLFMATKAGSVGLALRSFGDVAQAQLQPTLSVKPAQDKLKSLTARGN